MPKTILYTSSAPYQKTVTLHVPHYESSVADIQPCVEHLFCKNLGEGTLAVYGSYAIFLLFTCADFSGKRNSFHILIRQAFSVLLEGKISETDTYEIQFVPNVTAHSTDTHALEWLVEIKADAKAVFYAETPDPSPPAVIPVIPKPTADPKQPQPPVKRENGIDQLQLPAGKEEIPAPEKKLDTKDRGEQNAQTDEKSRQPVLEKKKIQEKCWKIRSDASISMDELLDMDEAGRQKFMDSLR